MAMMAGVLHPAIQKGAESFASDFVGGHKGSPFFKVRW